MLKTRPKSTFSGNSEMPIRRYIAHYRYSFLHQAIPAVCSGSGGGKSTALVQLWFPSLSADPMKLKKQVEKYPKIPSHFLQFKALTIMFCKSLR